MKRTFCAMLGSIALCLLTVSGTALAQWNGEVIAWGYNNYGQCDVPSPNNYFLEIAGGYLHCLGLKEDGSIVAWGIDDESSWDFGQVTDTPTASDFISVAAGGWHNVGIKEDYSLVAWGRNESGQCDLPSPNDNFVTVVSGLYHNLALKEDGSIVTETPTEDGFIAVSAGDWHSLGLRQDGSIVAWGRDVYGLCDVPEPNESFVAIVAGRYHNLALKEDSSIVAWGIDDSSTYDYGQVTETPTENGFVAVSASGWHSLGLKQDGSIVAWGRNQYGTCDVPEPNSGFVAVSGGSHHNLGLREIFTSTDEGEQIEIEPSDLIINNVSPNPFDSHVTVSFQSPGLASVTLEVFDVSGRLVNGRELGALSEGQQTILWDAACSNDGTLLNGVYLLRLVGGSERSATTRVILLR